MKISSKIIILCIAFPLYGIKASTCKADRDFLIVSWLVEHCAENVKEYDATDAAPYAKDDCANRINTELFTMWLMYFGPCKFDITGDRLVNKYIINVKAKYRAFARKGSLWNDPLNVSNMFDDKGSHIADRLPNGTIPNFDAESIHTKEDYDALVETYHRWLEK